MSCFPSLVRSASPLGEPRYALGDALVDGYLEFVAGRCRPNTVRAVAFDLKTFFSVIDRDPVTVRPADVFEFLADQRGGRTVVRLTDRESGLSARTIARRLSSVSGFYAYLARGDTPVATNPVPLWLADGAAPVAGRGRCRWCGCRGRCRESCRPVRSTHCSGRCARHGIGRWCWRCCSAGCAAAKCSGYGSATSVSPTVRCSSSTARAAINDWCRSPTPSSPPSVTTCATSVHPTSTRTGCSSC